MVTIVKEVNHAVAKHDLADSSSAPACHVRELCVTETYTLYRRELDLKGLK